MLFVVVAAQLAAGIGSRPDTASDRGAVDALEQVVARAAAANAQVPAGLAAYRARAETEIALLLRRTDASEVALQLEQVGSDVRWTRGAPLAQRIVGQRSLSVGLSLSMLNLLREPWVVPVLYGNRLLLPILSDSVGRGKRRRQSEAYALHPFGPERGRVYRFSGGDTIAVLEMASRRIPIVRIHVEPYAAPAGRALLFRGEVDLDADRGEIVRLRGSLVPVSSKRGLLRRLQDAAVEAVAFVELENAEVNGRYWLPAYQRIELQAEGTLSPDSRSILRIVTRFGDFAVTVDEPAASDSARGARSADSAAAPPWTARALSSAPADSVGRYDAWRDELGTATAAMAADDFDDVGPDLWRPTGPPRLELRPASFTEVFRFNRVEGAYTGYGAALRFRDAVPGLTLRGHAGWAWSEETVRGGAALEYRRRRWQAEARAQRALANTNDFRAPLDYGSATLPALLYTLDNYDYVDRRLATVALGRELPGPRGSVVRAELGIGSDRGESARRHRGLWAGDSLFRPNRGLDEGRYLRSAAVLDLNPNVSGDFLQPGVGARVRYERGDGDLDWQRLDAQLLARRNLGAFIVGARLAGGVLASDAPPPQQLFELGYENGLRGYDYKAFAGDRAALLRGEALYRLPVLRAPVRIPIPFARGAPLVLPGVSPSLVVGVHSGWARASSPATRLAIARLGARRTGRGAILLDPSGTPIPVSGETGDARTTIDLSLRLFGGFDVGFARAVDRRAEWRLVWGL